MIVITYKSFCFPPRWSSKNINIFKCGVEKYGLKPFDLTNSDVFDNYLDMKKIQIQL